ncbi:FxsA family protein [Orenia marismortui]|uniref:FxsA family protein n=1 Tax=Orenia marismortui TaxID=46469 RepID=UPI000366F3E7|nr:FxsA family protein [Orenia marismortui]
MFLRLLLLFTLIPMIELSLLIRIGSYMGLLPTLFLVAVTGVIGVSLAREQGFLVVSKIRKSLDSGKLPADSLIEGLLILIGGVMLLTPGLLTDISGFLLIIPLSRRIVRGLVKNKFKNHIHYHQSSVYSKKERDNYSGTNNYSDEDEWGNLSDSIDVDYEEIDD